MPKSTQAEGHTTSRRSYGGRSAEQRTADRRERLIDAALDMFGTVGYANSPIEGLCARANVSTRSFYEDMGSREALLIALVESITSRAAANVAVALADTEGKSIGPRVHAAFSAYLHVTCADHRSARVCYIEVVGVSAQVEEWRQAWRDRLTGLMVYEAQSAVERGEIVDRDFRLFAIAMIGAVNSLAQEWARVSAASGGATPTVDDVAVELANLATAGLERK